MKKLEMAVAGICAAGMVVFSGFYLVKDIRENYILNNYACEKRVIVDKGKTLSHYASDLKSENSDLSEISKTKLVQEITELTNSYRENVGESPITNSNKVKAGETIVLPAKCK